MSMEKDQIIAGLNPEQAEAVKTLEGPVLVLAGAEHTEEETVTLEDAVEMVLQRRENGERMKDAVRQVSADTGINKNELDDATLKAGQ